MSLIPRQKDPSKLLARCRSGDGRAWDELVDLYKNLVYSVAIRTGLGEDDASDVFQTTFLALYKNLDRIENPQTLPKWLSVTASREAQKTKRISARTVSDTTEDGRTLDEIVASEEATAEETAVQASDAFEVREALAKLNEKCRGLLELLYLTEESSYLEVSEKLGIPMGAIGPTRARCLEKLRKLLEETFGDC